MVSLAAHPPQTQRSVCKYRDTLYSVYIGSVPESVGHEFLAIDAHSNPALDQRNVSRAMAKQNRTVTIRTVPRRTGLIKHDRIH